MSKADEVEAIARLLGIKNPGVYRGSSIPDIIFQTAVARFDLPEARSMPQRAEVIARAAAVPWDAKCDSRGTPSGGGSTVTLLGLQRLRLAVSRLIDQQNSS